MNISKQHLLIINQNGPLTDSFELGFQLGLIQWPDLTRSEYSSMFDENFFTSARARGNESATPEEIKHYRDTIHNPKKIELPVVNGMRQVLEVLSKSCVIVINSSGNKEEIIKWLQRNSIDEYISGIYAKAQGLSKAEKFKVILNEYGFTTDNALYITDKIGDAREALSQNISVIAVTWGYQSASHLGQIKSEIYDIVNDPKALQKSVNKFFSM